MVKSGPRHLEKFFMLRAGRGWSQGLSQILLESVRYLQQSVTFPFSLFTLWCSETSPRTLHETIALSTHMDIVGDRSVELISWHHVHVMF